MKNPNPDFLLRICQADAYAAAVEFVNREKHKELFDDAFLYQRYLKHPSYNIGAGRYTDDGQMSIGVCEVLLQKPPWTQKMFADSWVNCFKRDWRDGYARGFQKFLESIKDGDEFLDKIIPTSTKNGAAMRAVPIGLLPDVNEVVRVAELQSKITHDSLEGTWAGIAVALMSHMAFHTDDDLMWLDTYVNKHMPKQYSCFEISYSGPPFDRPIVDAVDTVFAVHEVLQREKNLLNILDQIIEWGGDTDSAAAIAWGIASARYDGAELPEFFEYCLEHNAKYGVPFLRKLGSEMIERFS